jgi:hypothetical protein
VKLGPREKRLLAIAAVVVGIVVVYRLIAGLGPATAPEAGGRATQARRGAAGDVDTVVEVNVAALAPDEGGFEVGRDPFRYGAVPTPVPPPPPPPPPPEPRFDPTPDPNYVPPPPPPPTPPPPPSIDHLRFLGTFGPARARIAVIASGPEIYNVREGAVLEQQFVVRQIGYESVAIGFVDFPDAAPRRLAAGGFPGS